MTQRYAFQFPAVRIALQFVSHCGITSCPEPLLGAGSLVGLGDGDGDDESRVPCAVL